LHYAAWEISQIRRKFRGQALPTNTPIGPVGECVQVGLPAAWLHLFNVQTGGRINN
jgi:hypothetical protein